MPRKDTRLLISALGEYYMDLLTIDSWINQRNKAAQANSLLCGKLQEREQRIKDRVQYLAEKRGITADELWKAILRGDAEVLDAEILEPDDDE